MVIFHLGKILRLRLRSLKLGLTTWPDGRAWRDCGLLFLAFCAVAAAIGSPGGFFRFEVNHSIPLKALLLAAPLLLLRPALLEETLFRGFLLPHPTESLSQSRKAWSVTGSLAAYILSHPVSALFLHPQTHFVFINHLFLGVVGALGLATTLAYFVSGSLWPPVFIHWIALLTWLFLFGGHRFFV